MASESIKYLFNKCDTAVSLLNNNGQIKTIIRQDSRHDLSGIALNVLTSRQHCNHEVAVSEFIVSITELLVRYISCGRGYLPGSVLKNIKAAISSLVR